VSDCLTCKWAKWTMTKHNPPRMKNGSAGTCTYPMTRVALPSAFRGSSYASTSPEVLERMKCYISRERPFVNCRVWEKAD
jgi:hypothetical protein